MIEIHIRTTGRAGRITLHRPKALNALTYRMALEIEAALDVWADDDAVDLVVIDAEGDRAFCAGGDIQDLYDTAVAGDFGYGRTFWRDEYRLNAKIAAFPKPFVAFMQGFVMGGGVGISCHGSHRVVCDSTQIAMPECGIGLVPDVGGSHLLANAPGRMGEYLGMSGARMGPGDAIYSGFADTYVSQSKWSDVIAELEASGGENVITRNAEAPPPTNLSDLQSEVDQLFSGQNFAEILSAISRSNTDFAAKTLHTLGKKSPLSVAATPDLIAASRADGTMSAALANEYRFTYRSASDGDFVEGIKATIIDRSHTPVWRYPSMASVDQSTIDAMLAPLGDNELTLEGP
ncbi:MAG: enoyl-CoA hydratase/isomerase family protein [Pseudomonadota bacterium]